ncbi:putative serine/threonine-protein kinase [Auxenochlorella protothecoides]|uniref:non-specific serine/threonine protein kinase n=1 Tax=Auxenochlorella protothecoides TaxID=3075 RepID=A0A087SSL8_AUXPR|nr:putative serine/threonine-protein kinase [Auxenochlorella protothecoides]KFM28722.1 putative serine/threonine-protein kinase [Auxenochlorella protothecoides]
MPRLALGKSCHSTLAGREAAAMLVTSREAECGSGARTEGSARILEAGSGGAPGALALMGQRQRSLPSSARQRRRSISSVTDASEPGSLAAELSYREERKARPLYASPALHAQVLALVLRLLVSPAGRMDRGASDPFPCERGLPNAPHVLRHHLAHPGNAGVLADLAARCAGMGPATLRLLRLVSGAGFRPAWYARRARMSGAAGAYATVLDAARGVQDRCSSVDVHAEVGVMQALTDSRRAARLHDYGFDPGEEAYVLVLQEYACSLRQWRLAQAEGGPRQAGTYLRIFREILRAVQASLGAGRLCMGELADRGIAHFDLKCDNVLLQPRDPPSSQGPRGTPGSMQDALPFEVVLADFGESIQFDSRAKAGAPSLAAASGNAGADPGQQLGATAAITNRVRGTDVFKSPEMLLLGGAHDRMDGDRRRRRGVGPASDVWSLGCLLFELVTGQHLVTDPDWATLVARVAAGRLPLFTPDRLRLIQDCPAILDLIRFMLVREAQLRPTLRDVSLR